MHNCIILGSGRSGTSMLAGTLAKAGYFMGEDLYPARDSNPKGFFEDPIINGINESILAPLTFKSTHPIRAFFKDYPLRDGQRWLQRVPVGIKLAEDLSIIAQIRNVTARKPFCFKDPRFSYTLPIWRPYLDNTVFLCIFRDPAITAASILKECRDMEYLQSVQINFNIAVEVWTLMYRHILEMHSKFGQWLFVHYDQVLNGQSLKLIESITGAGVDASFPESHLKRSQAELSVPKHTKLIYSQLCERAAYSRPL